MTTLDFHKNALNSVGWFIPPYVTLGFLGSLSKEILSKKIPFNQQDLEEWLSCLYLPDRLAAMVVERYPTIPFVKEYKEIIAESVQAHFLGLDHIAASGLIPVIEGASRKMAASRGIKSSSISDLFVQITAHCRKYAMNKNIGIPEEIVSMMESFSDFTGSNLYINSSAYVYSDKTNRHGIVHGEYSDKDYGFPINFYKAISAIDFLCIAASLEGSFSWFSAPPTERSKKVSEFYKACLLIKQKNQYSAANVVKKI
jgi:hypothetical protein